jgi:hypothetical protein
MPRVPHPTTNRYFSTEYKRERVILLLIILSRQNKITNKNKPDSTNAFIVVQKR